MKLYVKYRRNLARILTFIVIIALFSPLLVLQSPKAKASSHDDKIKTITSVDDLKQDGIRIGVASDMNLDDTIKEKYPNATLKYSIPINGYESVKTGKLDAYIIGQEIFEQSLENGLSGLKVLEDEPLIVRKVGFGISRDCDYPDFENKINEFINQSLKSHFIEDLRNKWLIDNIVTLPKDYPKAENPKYKLTVATSGEIMGYSYYEGTELVGCEVELAYYLAEYLNAEIEFKTTSFDGMLAGLKAGKYDLVASNLYITDDRKEEMTFSVPYLSSNIVYIVRDEDSIQNGYAGKLKHKNYKTLIAKDRWRTLLNGLGITLIISFGGFILANIIGVILCAFSLSKKKWLNKFASIFVKLMQGTPVVVLLMILYYLVFAKVNISSVLVSILVFGMSTGATLSLSFRGALKGVNHGQWEAAYSLGFSKRQTFFGVIFPQATVGLLPMYFNQFIALMKGTAVVGYVAIVDLTKVGDIIRSSTFDAFIPLVTVAVIYLIIASIMVYTCDIILKHIDPTRKKRSIKGIKPETVLSVAESYGLESLIPSDYLPKVKKSKATEDGKNSSSEEIKDGKNSKEVSSDDK